MSSTASAPPVIAVAVPSVSHGSQVSRQYPTTHLADAYAVRLPAHASTDPERLARFLLAQQAPWVGVLMRVRDAIVARLGLKTAAQLEAATGPGTRRIGIFKIYQTGPQEILLGEDDKHLDFRISVLLRTETVEGRPQRTLTASTVVHCHNRVGRLYILLIAPFHRLVVQSMLRRAVQAGWPE